MQDNAKLKSHYSCSKFVIKTSCLIFRTSHSKDFVSNWDKKANGTSLYMNIIELWFFLYKMHCPLFFLLTYDLWNDPTQNLKIEISDNWIKYQITIFIMIEYFARIIEMVNRTVIIVTKNRSTQIASNALLERAFGFGHSVILVYMHFTLW